VVRAHGAGSFIRTMTRAGAAWAFRRGLALVLLAGLGAGLVSALRGSLRARADFVFNNGTEITTLDPATITGQPEMRVAHALYEGLTVKDPATLAPRPGVAESWDVAPDGRRYVFHLRAARWSNGDPITAEDFAWSWQRLLLPETAAPYAYQLWCVRGARAFAEAPPEGRAQRWREVGLSVEDARTLVVELDQPVPWFLTLTSSPALFPVHRASLERVREREPERWQSLWLRPGRLITNGPFKLVERRVNDRLRLVKNQEYWDADAVAFASLDVLAIESLSTMLNLYLAGEIDWLDRVPTDLVPALLERPDFRPAPYLATYFYRVNTTRPPFDDARVRRALALAIDRRAISEKILKKGEHPCFSLTPEGLSGYPRPELAHAADEDPARAFAADLAEARALLAQAGYGPGGRPLPTLEIHFNTSEAQRDVAEVVGDTWTRALGLPVRYLNQEWKVYLETQKRLEYDVSRSSWIGDYPDSNNFLEAFRGGGENNRTGWRSARYDELLGAAARELDPERRLATLAEAEGILLAELPVLPIYGYVSQNLVSARLDGFYPNVLDEHPPKFWRWKSAPEPRRRASAPEPVPSAPGAAPR